MIRQKRTQVYIIYLTGGLLVLVSVIFKPLLPSESARAFVSTPLPTPTLSESNSFKGIFVNETIARREVHDPVRRQFA